MLNIGDRVKVYEIVRTGDDTNNPYAKDWTLGELFREGVIVDIRERLGEQVEVYVEFDDGGQQNFPLSQGNVKLITNGDGPHK